MGPDGTHLRPADKRRVSTQGKGLCRRQPLSGSLSLKRTTGPDGAYRLVRLVVKRLAGQGRQVRTRTTIGPHKDAIRGHNYLDPLDSPFSDRCRAGWRKRGGVGAITDQLSVVRQDSHIGC
jgi:hypothetical protein